MRGEEDEGWTENVRVGALLLLNQMVTSSRVRVMTRGTRVRWPCSISLRGCWGRKAPDFSPSTTGAKASQSPSCTYFSPYTCRRKDKADGSIQHRQRQLHRAKDITPTAPLKTGCLEQRSSERDRGMLLQNTEAVRIKTGIWKGQGNVKSTK